MKTRFGKITVSIILLLATAAILVGYMATKAMAATRLSSVKYLPVRLSGTYSYFVLVDATTGWVVDKDTGISSTDETWAGNPLDNGGEDDQTSIVMLEIPSLDKAKSYLLVQGEAASAVSSPATTDTIIGTYYYSPDMNIAYSTDFPAYNGKISIK